MKNNSTKNIFIAFILNITFSLIELIGGIFTNSISIMADSIHDLGDAISILISLVLEKISKKKPNQDYTFGYLRFSVLGALITSSILFIGSFLVIANAITRLINPIEVNYDGMLVLALIGIIVNLTATYVTSRSNSLNERAVSLHMLEDVLGWFSVFIGSIVIRFTNLYIIDPILSILVSLFILVNVLKKYKNIFEILLQKKPEQIDELNIKNKILEIDEIKDIHHIHIWTIDGINNYITLHVLISDNILVNKLEEIKKKINVILKENNINHSTIEFETKECKKNYCDIKSDEISNHHHH